MRQRKVKNEEERLGQFQDWIVENPQQWNGCWKDVFLGKEEIYLEVGCGKGQFITTLAAKNPQRAYIGAEGRKSVLLRALEKAASLQLKNICFIDSYIHDITEVFADNEISGLYLNFSDPWPKDRHAKRRLTHQRFLKGYKRILKSGSFLEFKSDNDDLFAFTLTELQDNGLTIVEYTKDLHQTDWAAKSITTEYEDKFVAIGKNINYCKVIIE